MKMRTFVALLLASTLASAATPIRADRILILKSERKLQLLNSGKVLRTYKVALGPNPKGHKEREGDGRTPEGVYVIDYRNGKSQFYRALHVSYPNAADRAAARKRGVSPGGMIMIHGLGKQYGWLGSAHTARDWTLGCIAVTNEEINDIWNLVADGTPVEIRP
jgi:murein L,D-transpeptidase YafK